jgi:hypothetical protein
VVCQKTDGKDALARKVNEPGYEWNQQNQWIRPCFHHAVFVHPESSLERAPEGRLMLASAEMSKELSVCVIEGCDQACN